ncbi:MAG: helix-turn-helix transcriptional regulator [Kiritimatiellae bacterium]|nr:helix-turn-helix transcriptional regulator [Kiritimatiellia bacterium]
MTLCYNRLWELLIDRGMTRTQIRLAAGISTSTLAKLSKGEDVNTSMLVKIRNTLTLINNSIKLRMGDKLDDAE